MRRVGFFDFRGEDALRIALQASQLVEAGIESGGMTLDQARDLEGDAWTARAIDSGGAPGRILCCAGFRVLYPGRQAIAWAMLAGGMAAHELLAVTRFARAKFAESPLVRIEAITRDAEAERHWAELVGMRLNTKLMGWGAASETVCLFERVDLAKGAR